MSAAPNSLRPSAKISGACFLLSAFSFVTGWVLVIAAAPDVVAFFYQPRVIAIVHTFTLGWISLAMTGVLFQYVPALTKEPLLLPRLAPVQVALFAFGTSGVVAHFWIRRPVGMVWSAACLLAAVLLLALHLGWPLWRSRNRDTTTIGLSVAVLCLLGTATLGFLFAVNTVAPFLGGGVFGNLAAHAHLGLLGWITLTMCVVSYRMSTAFLLPTEFQVRAIRWQVGSLIVIVPLLVLSLLLRSRVSVVLTVLLAASLGRYASIIVGFLRTRRMPVDWSTRHVLTAFVHLAVAGVAGLALLTIVDPGTPAGSRLTVAYGTLVLFGWISNYIVGFGSRMMSGMMGSGGRVLLANGVHIAVYGFLNLGVAGTVAAVLAGDPGALRVAACLPLAAGTVFAAALFRRAMK
ncbi:hypothetical protein L6Q96_06525 [Candidatus Binatia bacterium]|nr:hypothetical protein [Candidatus Binatia bacterium]